MIYEYKPWYHQYDSAGSSKSLSARGGTASLDLVDDGRKLVHGSLSLGRRHWMVWRGDRKQCSYSDLPATTASSA